MKVYLLYPDQDYVCPTIPLIGGADVRGDVLHDVELSTVWKAMALGDESLELSAKGCLLANQTDPEVVIFRQAVLRDCLANRDVVRELYSMAVEAVDGERKVYRSIFGANGESKLRRSVEVIELFVDILRRLRALVDGCAANFRSAGFRRLFEQIRAELDEPYFDEVQAHLRNLKFSGGIVMSARLGPGNQGVGYVLRRPRPENQRGRWNRNVLKKPTYGFSIPDRDEAGYRALSDLREHGVLLVAEAVTEAAEHVLAFFAAFRLELGFYIGALNLYEQLAEAGAQVCYPTPRAVGSKHFSARGLYDPALALHLKQRIVGNDVDAAGKDVVLVTGANQGGKSTFLRSVGLAHLMMQSGMFVAAQQFESSLAASVLTHYIREEDATMTGGKFDEELRRMSSIIDILRPGSLVLCNESFAATNEREGSEVALEIIHALTDSDVRIFYVSHMYELAHRLQQEHGEQTLFLRAEREQDGRRTFQLRTAAPLRTSFGEDIYRKVFAA